MRLPPRLCEKGNTLLFRYSAWLALPVFTPLPAIYAMGSSSPDGGRRSQSTVGLVDLPPELLTMVAAALLRLCYIDSSCYCVPGTWRNRKLPPPRRPLLVRRPSRQLHLGGGGPRRSHMPRHAGSTDWGCGGNLRCRPQVLVHQPEFHSDDLSDGGSHGDIMSR